METNEGHDFTWDEAELTSSASFFENAYISVQEWDENHQLVLPSIDNSGEDTLLERLLRRRAGARTPRIEHVSREEPLWQEDGDTIAPVQDDSWNDLIDYDKCSSTVEEERYWLGDSSPQRDTMIPATSQSARQFHGFNDTERLVPSGDAPVAPDVGQPGNAQTGHHVVSIDSRLQTATTTERGQAAGQNNIFFESGMTLRPRKTTSTPGDTQTESSFAETESETLEEESNDSRANTEDTSPTSTTTVGPIDLGNGLFMCPFPGCTTTNRLKGEVRQHHRTHVKDAICDLCGKKVQKNQLTQHKKSKEGHEMVQNKLPKCPWCDVQQRKDNLKRHMEKCRERHLSLARGLSGLSYSSGQERKLLPTPSESSWWSGSNTSPFS